MKGVELMGYEGVHDLLLWRISATWSHANRYEPGMTSLWFAHVYGNTAFMDALGRPKSAGGQVVSRAIS